MFSLIYYLWYWYNLLLLLLLLLQCNEPRSEDAPAADITLSNPAASGKKGSEAGQND